MGAHPKNGKQKDGTLEEWKEKRLEYWNSGMMEECNDRRRERPNNWNDGMLEEWKDGTRERRNNGRLEYWKDGRLERRDECLFWRDSNNWGIRK